MVKKPPAMWETWVWSLGWEDLLEEGTATHSSILAWRILWTEKPGGPQCMGSQSQTGLMWLSLAHSWFTMLHKFQVYSKVIQLYTYMSVFAFWVKIFRHFIAWFLYARLEVDKRRASGLSWSLLAHCLSLYGSWARYGFYNFLKIIFYLFTYLFIWLGWVSVMACGIFSLWHANFLVVVCRFYFPEQGSNPGSLHWEHGVLLNPWTPTEVPWFSHF